MTTIRINLLPHREERRKRARAHFAVVGAMTVVLGLVIVGAVHVVNAQRVAAQQDRNTFLKNENSKLDKQIADIKKLKDEIQACWRASRSSKRCRPIAPRPCICWINWCDRCRTACISSQSDKRDWR
jgi:hypothetical protein